MIKFLEKSGLREKIDAFFGLHVYRDLERGAFNIKDGVQLASSGEVDIRLESAGGHVIDAYDEPNLNRILSEISVKLHDIFEPLYRGGEGLVASTRTDYPKGGYNVLPSSGEATWVVRIASEELYREMSQEVFEQIREVVREIVERHGKEKVEVSVRKRAGYRPVVHRDPELVELSAETAEEVLPDARRVPGTIMGGEDFAFYLEDLRGRQIHGTFMMVGGANPEKGIPLGKHHAEDFRIDPEILQELAAIHVTSVHRAIEHFQSKK
jgi:metal-dependent amidase/aminoacylase/carboxypeptidase family protein